MNNECVECGKIFTSVRKTMYCCDACRQKYQYNKRKQNGENPYLNQKERGVNKKIKAVLVLGGKCTYCGYDKNLSALEFHHTDPSAKEFALDLRVFSNLSDVKLNMELEKCVLLCANCHREVHNPDKNAWSI